MAAALGKLKKWFARKRPARPSSLPLGPPPALLERYLQYKRLLAADSAILTTVADIQVKMDEGLLFDLYYVREACDRLGREVEAMVGALNGMAGDRYAAWTPPAGGWPNWWRRLAPGAQVAAGAPGAAPGRSAGRPLQQQGREIRPTYPPGARSARSFLG